MRKKRNECVGEKEKEFNRCWRGNFETYEMKKVEIHTAPEKNVFLHTITEIDLIVASILNPRTYLNYSPTPEIVLHIFQTAEQNRERQQKLHKNFLFLFLSIKNNNFSSQNCIWHWGPSLTSSVILKSSTAAKQVTEMKDKRTERYTYLLTYLSSSRLILLIQNNYYMLHLTVFLLLRRASRRFRS